MRRSRSSLNFSKHKRKVNMDRVKSVAVWTLEILITVLLAFTIVYFVGLRTSVVGNSMSDTLESGESILVNRFVYKVSNPKRGDLVVFLPNGNEKSHYYVKRVVGVPGDKVQIIDGYLYVNGELYDEETNVEVMSDPGLAEEEITLESGEYFVLGDNRNNSEDSRFANIGNVRKDYIIGKAWFKLAGWGDLGFL